VVTGSRTWGGARGSRWAVAGYSDQKAGSYAGPDSHSGRLVYALAGCRPLDGSESRTGPDSHSGRSVRVPAGCRPLNGCPKGLRRLYSGSRGRKRMSVGQEARIWAQLALGLLPMQQDVVPGVARCGWLKVQTSGGRPQRCGTASRGHASR
jgi:hypothetical protein